MYLGLPSGHDVGVSNTFELVLGNRALVCFLIFQEVDCKIHDCCLASDSLNIELWNDDQASFSVRDMLFYVINV